MNRHRRKTTAPVILTLAVTAAVLLLLTAAICAVRFLQEQTRRDLYPRKYSDIVSENSTAFGVPEDIIYAVIRTESSFRADAQSSAGAMGLMQLTRDTYEWIAWRLGEEADPDAVWEPAVNIRYGCYNLQYLYEKFGSWETAFAAYNAGAGRVEQWLADPTVTENGKLVNIPYPETENYIKKVCAARQEYIELYYTEHD